MKHSKKKQTLEKLKILLCQYKEYEKAVSETEKDCIGNSMMYADPIIWMMYKKQAYVGSHHEINTLGDLKEHSINHGGICAKRMEFLAWFIKENYMKNILNSFEFGDDITVEDFYDNNLLNEVVSSKEFMRDWEKYEYFKDGERVAKWENYII